MNEERILVAILKEVESAIAKHGNQSWGRHEFFGILKEEVDEAWDDIKSNNDSQSLAKEIIQIAAVCVRYLDSGDRYDGPFNLYSL